MLRHLRGVAFSLSLTSFILSVESEARRVSRGRSQLPQLYLHTMDQQGDFTEVPHSCRVELGAPERMCDMPIKPVHPFANGITTTPRPCERTLYICRAQREPMICPNG